MKLCPYCRSPNHDAYQLCVRCRRVSPQEEQRRRFSTMLLPARERETLQFVPAQTGSGEIRTPLPQTQTAQRPTVQQGPGPRAVQAPPRPVAPPQAQPVAEPRSFAEWNEVAMQHYNAGAYERADAAFQKCLEFNPGEVGIWMYRGVALRCLRKVDEALACFDKAIELRPDSLEAWRRKGFTLRILNRTDDAIRCYDKILELNPKDTAALNDKANALDDLRRYAEAVKVYEQVLAINPKDRYAIDNKEATERLLKRKAADDYRSSFFKPKPV
jgi:tetratricopeptide (TPR) repeat protein